MANKVTRTQAITALLRAKTHPDLAAMYTPDMECQMNVAQDGGTRIESEYHGRPWVGWTDGLQTWKAIRIPYNASTEPEYTDIPMSFDIAHAEAIGMTGWDWKNRISMWVAFDFDAITGHAEKHQRKLTDAELEDLQKLLNGIDWITLRRSTSGSGIHVYVFLEPVYTKNHTEHAALARSILGKISALTKTTLETKVDVCGQNMWVWHRKMTKENQGLVLLKSGTKLTDIPINWKDHIKVISGERKKLLPRFLDGSSGDSPVEKKFNDLSHQFPRVPLDDEHRKFIEFLEKKATGSWWDADNYMVVTHTFWLKEAHETLGLRGKFNTSSAGTEAPNDINCFLFPLRRGGWVARRYSLGVQEHDSWDQDGRGWTRTYYNTDPTLSSAARMNAGLEDPAGGFEFSEAEMAAEAVRLLGGSFGEIPLALRAQKAKVKAHKDGRVIVEIEGDKNGILGADMRGWLFKGKKWVKLVNVNPVENVESEGTVHDDIVRHLITNTDDDAGWALRSETATWTREPLTHVSSALHTLGLKPNEIKTVIGNSVLKAWKLVNRPFQPEYPGDRIWNEKAAQLRYVPSQGDTWHYPNWRKVLDHIGRGLTSAIQNNAWAKNNGILNGGDYLKIWIASLFKEPLEPLPYLFLYGPQNTGKSILHEGLSRLFTRGYVRADVALQNQQGFNEELANAVLCVVEEIDLRRDKNAANRIKDWVTARDLSIHPKGRTPYQIANATHWIQASNSATACPVLPGDTRITSIYVEGFENPGDMIPKKQLLTNLEQEAPDFLAELLSLDIPPSNDRLNVPVIRTAEKSDLESFNRTPVEAFLAEICYAVPGEFVPYGELYDKFVRFLDPSEAGGWTKQKFGRELPPQFPKGRSKKDAHYIVGNLTLTRPDSSTPSKPRLRALPPDGNDYVFLEPESTNGNHT